MSPQSQTDGRRRNYSAIFYPTSATRLRAISGNSRCLNGYFSSGNANLSWIRTPSELQNEQLSAFATIGILGIGALEALQGPAGVDLNAALQIQGTRPLGSQTISILGTNGPTFVAASGNGLTQAQATLAEELSYSPILSPPGYHAEENALLGAMNAGYTPTYGVSTNNVCGQFCGPMINSLGGGYYGNYYSFPNVSPPPAWLGGAGTQATNDAQ